ncbi:translocation/assembly module TamB domain-containing protein [Phascolarctobacterium sp.]|uniref:translocation/assembly module TamB domain-containing protein n=1 Tax=Phascolarctobacterium sp. TaxID=2049039 RepID=UPI0030769143
MNKLFRWLLGVAAIIGVVYYSIIKFVVPGYLAQVPPLVSNLAQSYINGTVDIGRVEWNGAFELTALDVQVKDKRQQQIAALPSVKLHIEPWYALFNTNKALDRVILDDPTVYLTLNKKDIWNVQDFLKPSDSEETPFYGVLEIRQGTIITDTPYGKWEFGLNGAVDAGGNPKFAIDAKLAQGQEQLQLKGLVNMQAVGNLALKSERFTLSDFAPLAEEFAYVKDFQGSVADVNLLWSNDGKDIAMSGSAVLDKLTGIAVYEEWEVPVGIDGKVTFNDKDVKVSRMLLTVDGQTAQLEGDVDFKDKDNIQGRGLLAADALTIRNEEFKKVSVPFRIIDNKVQVNTARAEFGGGRVDFLAEYDLGAGNVVAALDLKNVKTAPLAERPADVIAIDGSMAMKGVIKDDKFAVNLAADTVRLSWRDLLLHKVDFDIDVDQDGCKINNLSAFTETGALLAQGTVSEAGFFKLHGSVTDFPIAPVLEAFGQQGDGFLAARFDVSGTADAVDFTGFTQLKQVELDGLKIAEAHGGMSMRDSVVILSDYKVLMAQGESILNGSIDLKGQEPAFNLEVSTDGVRAEPFVKAFAPDVRLTGNVNNKMLVTGTLSSPNVVGQFLLTDGSAEGYLVDKIQTDYSYQENDLVIRDCDIIALSTEAKLNGRMDAARNLDFKVDIKDIDLSALPISDDTVELGGYADAHGTLTGTLSRPFFHGDVSSKSIFINGEELTDIACKLDSDGGIKNHLLGSFKQAPEGVLSSELNYDHDQKLLQGNIVAIYGNVRSILKMARADYDVDGLAQGEIAINPHGPKSGVFVDVWVDDITIGGLKYEEMKFNGHLQDQIWYFDDVKLMETKAVTDKGIIAVGGQVNLADGKLEVEAGAVDANPALVTALMADPTAVTGDLNMFVQLHGTLKDPEGNGSIEIKNGSVAGIGFDDFTAMLSLANDNLKIEQAMVSKDIYKASAYGDVPLDLFRSREQRRDANAQMNVELNLDNTRLGIFQMISPMVEWGVGETQGQVKLAGTLEEPLVYGAIKIPDGSLKFKHVQTVIENIHTDVEFEGNKVELKDISAKLGKGTFKGSGTYALRSNEREAYKLNLVADNAEIASDIFTGRINGELTVTPQRYIVRPDPNVAQPPGKGPRFDYRPLLQGTVRFDDVLVNMPTIPEFGDGESNIGLDVQVTLGPKIHLYNKYLYDLWLAGGLHIQGSTLYTNIGGTVSANRGTISYLRTQFKVRTASAAWPVPGSVLPTVNLEATAKFQRYDIGMHISGPLEEMDLQLNSSPPLTKDQIVRMLTLQRESTGSEGVDSDDLQNLMTAGLEMAVFGDVEQIFKEALGLDEFRVYSGKLRSGIEMDTRRSRDFTADERNQYNVLFSKYLTDNFMVGYTTSMDNEHHSVFGQYEISRHLNINYSLNENNENWYGVEYRVTF